MSDDDSMNLSMAEQQEDREFLERQAEIDEEYMADLDEME